MTPFSICSAILVVAFCLSVHGKEKLNPVIVVPGFGGNQLEAKLDNAKTLPWCTKNENWYNIWLSTLELAVGLDCMIDHMSLELNGDGTTSNKEGVSVRAPGFGLTDSVEYLNPNCIHSIVDSFDYFVNLIDSLTYYGYKKGESIRAAPYDFRKAPNEMSEYFIRLTKLIERTYKNNGNTPVVLLGHSMGGNIILYFLHSKSQEWKDMYVTAFISLGTPWAGSAKALKTLVSGDDLGHPVFFPDLSMRLLLRTFPATAWLLPHKSKWSSTEALIESPGRNYTIDDFESLFEDVGCYQCPIYRRLTENLLQSSKGPGVQTFCLYGVSEGKTGESYRYPSGKYGVWFDEKPEVRYGPGDETVNKKSLEVCRGWENTEVHEFPGATHFGMLSDFTVIRIVEDILKFDL